MAQYECMKDILYKDEIIARKGDIINIVFPSIFETPNLKIGDIKFITTLRENKMIKCLGEDNVNHPKHYTSHPSGIECIEITRHYCFSIGNAIKYLWRAGLKVDEGRDVAEKEIEDLNKAIWYINDRIKQLKDGVHN